MADKHNKIEEKGQGENNLTKGYRESDFMLLDDLVYAPLHALAQSNHQLRAQIVEAIKSMGRKKQVGKDEVIDLESLNIGLIRYVQKGMKDTAWTIYKWRFHFCPLCQ